MDSQGRPYPEILPPGAPDPPPTPVPSYEESREYLHRSYTPPEPQAVRRRRWAFAPATYILLAINCLIFLPMILRPDVNNWVLDYGANYGVAELRNGEWWRLFSATFIHVGFLHLATNMWCLWNLGLLGEPLLGSYGLIATYLVTGVAGNLLSTAIHPGIPGAGASGAIFGLAGVLIMLLNSPLLPVPPEERKRLRRSVIWFAVLNFVIGGGIWLARTQLQIDNMAHLGGFLSGLAVGLPLVPRIGAPRQQFLQRQWRAFGTAAFVLLLVAFGIYKFYFS